MATSPHRWRCSPASTFGAGRSSAAGADLGHLPWWFWVNPFRVIVEATLISPDGRSLLLTAGMVATLAVDVSLVFLAFRRAENVDGDGWAAALTIVPVLQVGALV